MKLDELNHKYFPQLFEAIQKSDPWLGLDRNTSDRLFSQREGFVLLNGRGEVVGHITMSDYSVKHDIVIHCSVIPSCQKRWLTREIYKQVFDFVFNDLECVRASGFAIEGINDMNFHERLGFSWEGCYRKGFKLWENYYNLHRYGILKDERRW